MEIRPVFPDFELWKYRFAHVQFDSKPAPSAKSEAMQQAIIQGMQVEESGEQFVGHFLPTKETLEKRKIDEQEGREYPEGLEYSVEHEYDWKAESKLSEGYANDYFFVFRDNWVVYNELETRIRLTKRRAAIGPGLQAISKLVVKYRPFEDCELRQNNLRLRSLRPPLKQEENEQGSGKGLRDKSDKESGREEKESDRQASELRQHDLKLRSPWPTEERMPKHGVLAPFIDLNSLFPANAHTSPDPKTRLTGSRPQLTDRNMPTNGLSFGDASSPSNIDCSAAVDVLSPTGVPRKKRKRGRNRKIPSTVTRKQSVNVSAGSNLTGSASLDRSAANQGHQPPLIDYDSADQNPDESSDSDRLSYATKRIRPVSNSAAKSYFSDSEFEHFYSEKNLYGDQKYFDNRKHRIFVQRYGDEIRVFKPVRIMRESGSLLVKVLGLYCRDVSRLRVNQTMPPGFIWPLSFGKHDENVATIRRLIKKNPVDDRLPYVSAFESAVVRPFSLDAGDENDENLDKKQPFLSAKVRRNESKTETDAVYKGLPKNSKPRAAHCPYCYGLFSASFNAKMHFKGRLKQSSIHISCPVSSKLSNSAITLEPVICAGPNCEECLKRQSNGIS